MKEERTTRRELFKSLGRYGALLGLTGGVSALAGRTACQRIGCAACPLVARCGLEDARKAREGRS